MPLSTFRCSTTAISLFRDLPFWCTVYAYPYAEQHSDTFVFALRFLHDKKILLSHLLKRPVHLPSRRSLGRADKGILSAYEADPYMCGHLEGDARRLVHTTVKSDEYQDLILLADYQKL